MAINYEYSSDTPVSSLHIGDSSGAFWGAQTFTVGTLGANENFNVSSVKIRGSTTGSPSGVITVSIRATSAGLPTGGDLCSGTTSFPSGTEWKEITMSPSYKLNKSTKYALVVRATSADHSNYFGWTYNYTGGSYTGGEVCTSTDSGSSWTANSGFPSYYTGDAWFEIWGNFAPDSYAISTSIDYNNGTVQIATLTPTSTGNIHYWMSADGGSNWLEGIESSGSYAFLFFYLGVPGTDLRWKAGGETGATLTKVEVNGLIKF